MSTEIEKPHSTSLKSLLSRLREINAILDSPEDQLDFLATATPQDKKESDSPVSEDSSATLDSLSMQIDKLARKSNHIAKSTSIIVGN